MKRRYTFYLSYSDGENLVVETELFGLDQDGFLDIDLSQIECITDEESGDEIEIEDLNTEKLYDLIDAEIEKNYKKLSRLFDENN